MQILPIIYLGYMFISLYMLFLFLLLYLKYRKTFYDCPHSEKIRKVSVAIPAYNEEDTIQDTINAIFASDYPVYEVIVINDGSKDRTAVRVAELMKKYPKLKLVTQENAGKAASLNHAIKLARGELFAVVDADSYPRKDAIGKLAAYFNDEKVGVATAPIIPRNSNKFIEVLQTIEYSVIAFTRKLLGYVDAIYVTPGPLAVYRLKALKEINGFDTKNLTEDIEATWHLTLNGWKREMCLGTIVTTSVPSKFKNWYTQRRRWNMGGVQCINKYKKFFFKKGMLGFFILPFFVISTFLGLLGLGIFVYLITRRMLKTLLFTKYSVEIGTPLLTMQDFYITPSVLNYLGIALFILGASFTLLVLKIMREYMKKEQIKKQNVFNILFYLIVYLAIYPFIMISALYNLARGKMVWR